MNAHAAPPVVLVADDEPQMLELVARHLRSIDQPKLEVLEASDGDEAWRLARKHLPDLVVLDVMMPGMSGWEVCRKIRQDAALAHTGVLMLTGIGETLNETTSPLFGADEFIDKPFDFEALDEKVVSVLERRAAQREAVPRPAGAATDLRPATSSRGGNGVGGPAKAAKVGRKSGRHATVARSNKAKRSSTGVKSKRSKRKQPATAVKGKRKVMAAKKGAKKGAKKAKKGAKKGKKK